MLKYLIILLLIVSPCSASINYVENLTFNGIQYAVLNDALECQPLSSHVDLTHWWRFEPPYYLNDSVTGNNAVTLTAEGTVSYSSADPLEGSYTLELDGENDEAVVGAYSTLPSGFLDPPFSICFAFRNDSIDQVKYLVSQHDTSTDQRKIGIQQNENEQIAIWHSSTGGGPSEQSAPHPYEISLGEKMRVCYTEDADGNYTLDAYSVTDDEWKSGGLDTTWADGSANASSTADFYIGGRDGDSSLTHDGGLDDVMVFDAVLNFSEKHQYFTGDCYDPATGDIISPVATIGHSGTTVYDDLFLFSTTCTDANDVVLAKYRVSGYPDDDLGTELGNPDSDTASITGLSLGTNNLYLGCKDDSGNWGYDMVSVYYVPGGGGTYYVAQSSAGDGSGDSYANRMSLAGFNALSGGGYAGSTFYFYGLLNSQTIAPLIWGTEGQPVTLDGWSGGTCDPDATSDGDCSGIASRTGSNNGINITTDYITIKDFTLESYIPIRIGTYGGDAVTGTQVLNCYFGISSSYVGLQIFTSHDGVFDNNAFYNTGPQVINEGLQNISISAGRNNVISNNEIYGGKTCIISKKAYEGTPQRYESHFIGNVIYGNTCNNIVEEGITLDGNVTTNRLSPLLEYDTVSSVSGNDVTLTHANWGGGDDYNFVGLYMFVVEGSGTEQSQHRKITAQDGATFTIESSISGMGSGDTVGIGSVYIDNVIARNTVLDSFSTDRILLYGVSFNNLIAHNTVNGGDIQTKSLDREMDHYYTVTLQGTRGPVGWNLIRDNTDVRTVYLAYRNHDVQGSYSPYESYGNTVEDNEVSTYLRFWEQYYSIDGNYGGATVYNYNSTSTDIGANPITTFGSYGACEDGEITEWCSCGDVDYPVGFCCDGEYSALPCN